jgi:hypothetical protein
MAILNVCLIGKKLHSDNYISYKEFRVALWQKLFSYLAYVSTLAKLEKFYLINTILTPYIFSSETPINIASNTQPSTQGQLGEHKWKMLRKRVYCYHCKAVSPISIRKHTFGSEISPNTNQKRPSQSS